jgi:hypothetical protein
MLVVHDEDVMHRPNVTRSRVAAANPARLPVHAPPKSPRPG